MISLRLQIPALGFLLAALSTHQVSLAASSSDLLVVLDDDGRHYIAQHTLHTDEELLLLELPESRQPISTRFHGREQLTFSLAHEHNPNTLSLSSGNVVSLYQHVYSSGLEKIDDSIWELSITDAHKQVDSENAETLTTTLKWIFPKAAKLLSFGKTNVVTATDGNWEHQDNVLIYTQNGGELPELLVQYSLNVEEPEIIIDPCAAIVGPSDECSPDIDQDDIPDYRDVCLPGEDNPLPSEQPGIDELGCEGELTIVLKDINFEVGNSYLNAASRQVLDRVAIALQKAPEKLFEVAAHTDNAGSDSNNQNLSENRAAAVRHYLMLRGVGPNQLRSVGYGEGFPIASNRTRKGRGINRRIELKRLN